MEKEKATEIEHDGGSSMIFRNAEGKILRMRKQGAGEEYVPRAVLMDVTYQLQNIVPGIFENQAGDEDEELEDEEEALPEETESEELEEEDEEDNEEYDYDQIFNDTLIGTLHFHGFDGLFRRGRERDGEQNRYFGYVSKLNNASILFRGDTFEELESDFHTAVTDFLDKLLEADAKPAEFYISDPELLGYCREILSWSREAMSKKD